MSTRKGNVVLLEDFMKEAIKKAKQELKKRYNKADEETAKKIAYGAIKYSILKVTPEKNVLFSWQQALNFEGDSCPYIQYAYARISSILRKYDKKVPNKIDFSLLNKKEETEIVKELDNFVNIVNNATVNLRPHLITTYTYELAKRFNEYYHKYNILKEKENIKNARLLLISCIRQVLHNGLGLLGIDIIERM